VEPISFGGICVFTELCGCAGFVRQAHKAAHGGKAGGVCHNAIEVDYTKLPEAMRAQPIADLLRMDRATREDIEGAVAAEVAEETL